MKRLKMSQGNNQRKFKLLFFDEKVAVVNLLCSIVCLLFTFAYVFMRSNFPHFDIYDLKTIFKNLIMLWFVSAFAFLVCWIWVTERIRHFAIKKRIRGIIVANNVINILVLIFAEISDIGEVFD